MLALWQAGLRVDVLKCLWVSEAQLQTCGCEALVVYNILLILQCCIWTVVINQFRSRCLCDSSWNKNLKIQPPSLMRKHALYSKALNERMINIICLCFPTLLRNVMDWVFWKNLWLYHKILWNHDGNWHSVTEMEIRVKAHLSIYLQSWNDLRRTGPQAILLKFIKQKQCYIFFLYLHWLSHNLFHSMHVKKIFYRDISLNKEQKLTVEIFRERVKRASTSISENDWSGWSSREVSILLI